MTVRRTSLDGPIRGRAHLWLTSRLLAILVASGLLGMHTLGYLGACGNPPPSSAARSVATSAATAPGPASATSTCDGACPGGGAPCPAVVNPAPRAPLGTAELPTTLPPGHQVQLRGRLVNSGREPLTPRPIGLLLADLSVLRT